MNFSGLKMLPIGSKGFPDPQRSIEDGGFLEDPANPLRQETPERYEFQSLGRRASHLSR
jgi:hypothetical protein